MTSPASRSSIRFPTIPTGEVVGSFETYERAQSAVDQLARADFPLSEVSIVGSNLKSVERVTGKMNAGRAALRGLLSGIMLGIFVGLLVLIMSPTAGITTLLSVMLVAIGFSVLWTLIGYSLNPAKREFTSVMQILAAHFDVVVSPQLAGRAREALGAQASFPPGQPNASASAWPGQQPPTVHDPNRPQYGQPGPYGQSGQPGQVEPSSQPGPLGQYGQSGQYGQPGQSGQHGAPSQSEQQGGPGAQPGGEAQPAQPPRTYGEAQDAMRREREARRDGDANA